MLYSGYTYCLDLSWLGNFGILPGNREDVLVDFAMLLFDEIRKE